MLGFSPPELLRLLQLHQRLNLRPSKACVKYMAAVLEQHLQQQHARRTAAVVLQAQQQQEQQGLTQHAHHQQQEQQLEEEEVQPGFGSSSSGSSASSVDVLQLVMCTCGLSVWGVRLHLRSVAELLVCLEQHKEQLPLTVTLQVCVGSVGVGVGVGVETMERGRVCAVAGVLEEGLCWQARGVVGAVLLPMVLWLLIPMCRMCLW